MPLDVLWGPESWGMISLFQ